MSRYPNRIPSRPSRPVQENKPTERASDLSKDVWDTWAKNEKQRTNTTTCEDYIRNLSVKNRDYTIPTYRNSTNNTFSTIVKNEDIKEIRLVEGYNIVDFPIQLITELNSSMHQAEKKLIIKRLLKLKR